MSTLSNLPDADPAQFLKIAAQGTALATHADLWRWLQGDVQEWLAHDVLLVGWGDFRSGELEFDIVSSMPGVRTHEFTRAGIAPLIGYFRDCWVAARQLPCQLDLQRLLAVARPVRLARARRARSHADRAGARPRRGQSQRRAGLRRAQHAARPRRPAPALR